MKTSFGKSAVCMIAALACFVSVFTGCGKRTAPPESEIISQYAGAGKEDVEKWKDSAENLRDEAEQFVSEYVSEPEELEAGVMSAATQQTPAGLTASKSDLNDFEGLFTQIASFRGCMCLDMQYNCRSGSALQYAMDCTFNNWFSLINYYTDKHNWNDPVRAYTATSYDESAQKNIFGTPDPLNLFSDFYEYVRIDADKVDWVLKNIMNVTPDHSYRCSGRDGEAYHTACYYHDGYYYCGTGDAGDATRDAKVDQATQQADGTYVLLLTSTYCDGETTANTVTAELHEVDGGREWKIITIE